MGCIHSVLPSHHHVGPECFPQGPSKRIQFKIMPEVVSDLKPHFDDLVCHSDSPFFRVPEKKNAVTTFTTMMLPTLYTWILLSIITTWYLRSYLRLRHVPGPFWAKFSNLPRFLWVAGGKAHEIHIDLHRKYGDIVRIGPNMVSVTDPDEIPKIYDFAGRYLKVG